MRVEFAKTHEWHGEIRFMEKDKLVRVEFAEGHERHGEIRLLTRTRRLLVRMRDLSGPAPGLGVLRLRPTCELSSCKMKEECMFTT